MRSHFFAAILAAGFVFSGGASAQVYRDGYGRPADRYSPYDRGGYRSAPYDPVSRTLGDLRNARSYRWTDHHERKHFEKAESELLKFQERWSRGRFDTHRLDEAIENLQHLVDADRVSPRDRDILYRDLAALRDFRDGGRYDRR